jgi:predicted adenylyl cyclase CyaB
MKYEVEIKSLLQTKENAQKLRDKLAEQGISLANKYKQLNHYFLNDGDFAKLEEKLLPLFDDEKKQKLKRILEEGKDHSLRTREMEGVAFFVIKASVDDTTSSNGILRMEFEEKVDSSMAELDNILEESGFGYQAKWSREREEYGKDDFYITIDKNAGYGYVSEFEIGTENQNSLNDAKQRILSFMGELGLKELSQDRLERMFKFYNENWRNYYGTENVFNVE